MSVPAYQLDEELSPAALPGEDNLPYDDGVPVESFKHDLSKDLLLHALMLHWGQRRDYFAGGNMFLYFSSKQVKNNDFRGPDFFVVLDTVWRARKSWVVWEEGRAPDLIAEFLSPSTAKEDRTRKKEIYQSMLRVPYYILFDPDKGEVEVYRWEPTMRGGGYTLLSPDERGLYPCHNVGLSLGLWDGEYAGLSGPWLRWYTLQGDLLPTPEEKLSQEAARAEQEAARAEQEAARAEQEAQRADDEEAARRVAEARAQTLEQKLKELEQRLLDESA